METDYPHVEKKKIFLLGNSPLPLSLKGVRFAAGLRTYQFMMALLEFGHDVHLVTVNMHGSTNLENYTQTKENLDFLIKSLGVKPTKFAYADYGKDDANLSKKLQEELDVSGADMIIAVNTFPAYLACKLPTDLPIWSDLNGWILAEAQAQAYKLDTNAYIPHYLDMQDVILKRSDRFSVVSNQQRAALWGELAQKGRLTKETFTYEFTSLINNATEWLPGEYEARNNKVEITEKINPEAFNIFWLGGYNTWVDEDTLFEALEIVMGAEENIYYVSTGGEIKGLDDKTFANFKKKINKSKYKDRFIFLGWVDSQDIPAIYDKMTIGINVDRNCIETYTGARNRINEMLKYGLPVVTTSGSDISWDVSSYGLGIGVEQGDVNGLAAGILSLYELWQDNEDEDFELIKEAAQDYIEENCTYLGTCKELIIYLQNKEIKRAPDFETSLNRHKWNLKVVRDYIQKNGFNKFRKKLWQKLRSGLK